MITDGAYGSQENQRLAERKNTELITTALTGKPVDKFYAEFQFSEDGTKMLICPMGYVPLKTTYYPKTGMCRALFPKDCCEDCPHKNDCKSKPQKKNYAVHASASMVSRARYSEKLSTAKYIELTRLCNAIEGFLLYCVENTTLMKYQCLGNCVQDSSSCLKLGHIILVNFFDTIAVYGWSLRKIW